MAFEALRQQTLISPASSTSKKASSSDPIAAAASTTDPMVVSSPRSPSVAAAASGAAAGTSALRAFHHRQVAGDAIAGVAPDDVRRRDPVPRIHVVRVAERAGAGGADGDACPAAVGDPRAPGIRAAADVDGVAVCVLVVRDPAPAPAPAPDPAASAVGAPCGARLGGRRRGGGIGP